jgi:predicted rRNA methylase YqxC with S4 and FtsJ domains
MNLYKILKDKDLIINEKEYHELIFNREISVDKQYIDDPKFKLDLSKKNSIRIGIFQLEI